MNGINSYKKRRLLALLLIVAGLAGAMMPQRAAAQTKEGNFGTGLHWKYEDGTLTISNPNSTPEDMPNYLSIMLDRPWKAHQGKIEKVAIGVGVSSIGENAFRYCYKLKTVEFGADVKKIRDDAFHGCAALQTITIPTTVEEIDDGAFDGSGLTAIEVAVGNGKYESADGVLYNKETNKWLLRYPPKKADLTEFTIPDGVKSIGMRAFEGCKELKTVTIPKAVTDIETQAFAGCTGLTDFTVSWDEPINIDFGSGGTAFGPQEEIGWLRHVTLHVPANKKKAYEENGVWREFTVMQEGDVLTEGYLTSGARWKYEDGSLLITGDGTIPNFSSSEGQPWKAHQGLIKDILIGDGVLGIGSYAFAGCSNLLAFHMRYGGEVPAIHANVFEGITLSGVKLNVPEGKEGDYRAAAVWKEFGMVYDESSGSLLNGLKWSYNEVSKSLSVTNSTGSPMEMKDFTSDGQSWCDKFVEVTIGDNITSIGSGAFSGCTALENMTIPSSVTTIEDHAFASCTTLKNIYVAWDTPPSIQADVFEGVTRSGVKLHIPAADKQAAYEANGWTGFDFVPDGGSTPSPGTIEGTALTWKYEGGTLTISNPSSTPEAIPDFTGDRPWKAHQGVIESVVIETNVSGIGQNAFAGCTALKEVNVVWDTPPTIQANAFDGVTLSGARLHVPAGKVGDYRDATVWKAFGKITDGALTNGLVGDALQFDYTHSSKVLSIYNPTGTLEPMPNSTIAKPEPWKDFTEEIVEVTIGDDIQTIGDNAFNSCIALKNITISNSVVSIGEDAFNCCRVLKSITIPINVTSFGSGFLAYCFELKDVNVAWDTPPVIDEDAFSSIDLEPRTLHVPSGKVQAYRQANGWKKFGKITDGSETDGKDYLSTLLTVIGLDRFVGSVNGFHVQGSKKWKAEISAETQAWLEFTEGKGQTIVSESPDTVLFVKAKNANTSTTPRTGTITIAFEDGSGTPITLRVDQVAVPAPSPTPTPTPTPTPDPTPAPTPGPTGAKVGGLTLSATSLTLNGEKTFRFTVTIAPSDAADKRLIVSSSDETIVRVRILPAEATRRGLRAASDPAVVTIEGTVYGIGKAKIYVKSTDGSGLNVSLDVDVRSLPTANVEASGARIYAAAGRLYLTLPTAAAIHIYTVSGTLLRIFTAPAGASSVALPQGVYVVKAGDRTEKVVVN